VVAKPYRPSLVDRVVQSSALMLIVVFLFAALIGWAVAHALQRQTDPLVDRVSGFVTLHRRGPDTPARPEQAARARRSLFLDRVSAATSRARWSERLAATFELAEIETPPVQVVILTILGTLLAIAILAVTLGPLAALLGLTVPLFVRHFVLRRIDRKRRAFAEQLPDNLDVMASALRAGHSLVGALAVVADDAMEPSKSEFRRVIAEEQFGAQLEDAFKVAVYRMANQDLDQVALVARLQREVGSNSAEVLDRVVENIRARMEVRRLVRTLTAQGRLSRWVLTAVPVFLLLAMTLLGRSYMHPLFHQSFGRFLLLVAACMVALGSWLIGRIVDIKV
jgi:tight adherence protein B